MGSRSTTVALLIAVMLVPGPAGAQELDITVGGGRSGFSELGSPMAVAIHGQLPLLPRGLLRVVAGYRWVRDSGRRPGTTCDSYWPAYTACVDEPIVHETTLDQTELGAVVGYRVGPIDVRGGVLGVFTGLDGGSEGEGTGRPAGAYYPDEGDRGTALMAEAVWTPGRRLGVVGRVRTQTLEFPGCVTDTGTPFCGRERMTTLEVGVAVVGDLLRE